MTRAPHRRGRIVDSYEGWLFILAIAGGLAVLVALGHAFLSSSEDSTRATRQSNVRTESGSPPQTHSTKEAPN
jgi:hypothetical protein